MWKIVATIFVILGLLLFALSTGFFMNWSETALVNGSFGLGVGLIGALGAYVGRSSVLKTILYPIVFAIMAIMALMMFFAYIWPEL